MHRLLKRQLKKTNLDENTPPGVEEWQQFLARVSRAYTDADQDRDLIERSLTISSREMQELYERLRQSTAAHIAELTALNEQLQKEVQERTGAEAALRKLSRAVEQSASTVVITDLDGTIEFVNPAFSKITGYSAQEAIGQNPRILKSGQHPPEFYQEMWVTISRGDVWQGEMVNKKKNGELYWEAATISPVKDETGEISHYLAIKDDITERKKIEEALRKSERRYELATRAAKVGVWDWNVQTGEFYLDPSIKAILGYHDEEIPNDLEVWAAYIHPDDRQAVMEAFQAHIAGQTPEYVFEHRMRHKDSSIRWFLVRGKAIRDAQGNVVRVVGTDADITSLKQAEEELRLKHRQAETLRAAIQALTTTLEVPRVLELILSELEKVVPYDSVSVQQLTGHTLEIIGCRGFANPEEIMGLRFDLTAADNPNHLVIETREPLILHDPGADYPAFRAGRHAPANIASWLGVPLLFGDKPVGMIALDKQESGFYNQEHARQAMSFAAQAAVAIENARLFDEAQQAREAAQKASQLKSQFLARVSHELRSPLGAILGYAELVRDGRFGPLSAKQREIMSRIVGSTRYLADLVSDLLDQAQIEAGTIKLDAASFSLKAMVNQVMDRMNVLAQAKGLTLTTELAADAPATLSGDEKRLQQILVNLVDNAIKFTPEGTVQVRIYRPDPGHWAMQVADTGPGISPEAQAYIFDPFRQVDDPTAQRRAGVGLGLSIVRQLATMMGGEITLASEPGQGSTFTVLLPLKT